MVEMVNVIARGLEVRQATSTGSTSPSSTSSDTSTSSTANSSSSGNNTTTQSPLLFFVALGFGVVFTNLWYAFDEYGIFNFPFNNGLGSSSASSTVLDTTLVTERWHAAKMANLSILRACQDLIVVDVRRS